MSQLETPLTENKRVVATRFGRQVDAKTWMGGFGLHLDSNGHVVPETYKPGLLGMEATENKKLEKTIGTN